MESRGCALPGRTGSGGSRGLPEHLVLDGPSGTGHRPSLRNQFTWDTSYLHYFDGLNAAGQLHYSFFSDSWGIRAHSVDAEWRQSLGSRWTMTPRLRYYTQNSADFYAPYFFALSAGDLPKHYFSSDERLSAFGTVTAGLALTRQLTRGLSAEFGLEYTRRSGSLKAGSGGDDPFADLHSYTANIALRGSIDRPGGMFGGGGDEHAHYMGHHGHVEVAWVTNAHMMDEPGSVMVGYSFEQQRQGGTLMSGSNAVPFDITKSANLITGITMDMHMIEVMYAQSGWLNWMVMPQLVSSKMGMFMNDVNGSTMSMNMMRMHSYMASGGVGDTSGGRPDPPLGQRRPADSHGPGIQHPHRLRESAPGKCRPRLSLRHAAGKRHLGLEAQPHLFRRGAQLELGCAAGRHRAAARP